MCVLKLFINMNNLFLTIGILAAICQTSLAQDYAHIDVKYCNLKYNLNPNSIRVESENKVHFAVSDNKELPIFLELKYNFKISDIICLSNGKQLKFDRNGDSLVVFPNKKWRSLDSIQIKYNGELTLSENDALGITKNRRGPELWSFPGLNNTSGLFACKQDPSDKIDSVTITITSPKEFRTISNGVLIRESIDGENRTMVWHHKYPIAHYSIGLICSNLVDYSDTINLGNGTIIMQNFVYPGYLETARTLSQKLIPIFKLFCNLFGNYPFANEKFGMAQLGFNGTQSYQTLAFVKNFDLLLTTHELSHQWFGNAITCNSWNEVWLNESLATYSEYLAIEKGLIPDVSAEDWLSETRSNAQTDGSIIVKEPQSYADVFMMNKDCINDKGAMMIHSLRQIIGDEAFFKGLKNYATDPKLLYHTSKSEDFIRHFENVSGKSLKSFFNEWLYSEGIPSDLK